MFECGPCLNGLCLNVEGFASKGRIEGVGGCFKYKVKGNCIKYGEFELNLVEFE